jgi:7-cyano-7-deazaguanine synthase
MRRTRAGTVLLVQAVVLLSGGLDSATALAIAKSKGFDCLALSFDYGQRHRFELDCAQRQARQQGVSRHVITTIDLGQVGGSALTEDLAVPKDQADAEGIPLTYVPARNTIFLSYALAWAEVTEAKAIFIGVNAVDYSGYPDCRPEFIRAFQAMADLATKAGVEGKGVRIEAPLIDQTKAEIIKRGLELGVDYAHTTSCYDPDENGKPCAHCDACILRARGFAELGVPDPLTGR